MKTFLWCCMLLAAAIARADDTAPADCGKNHFILDDPAACWQDTGALHVPRAGHTATLLLDGRVLVAGGAEEAGSSAEIYDPSTGRWTLAASLHVARTGHSAIRLADGRVLALGGHTTFVSGVYTIDDTGEIYDPASDSWSTVPGPLTPRDDFSATLLKDGRVLVVGGYGYDDGLASCELYDPATGRWTETGSLLRPVPRRWAPVGMRAWAHTTTLLADGRVLVAGGFASDELMNAVSLADVYDPATGLWTAHDMSVARGYHTATLLADGRVMVTGGNWRTCDGGPGCLDNLLMTTEIFDPPTNSWAAGPPLLAPHESYTATLLGDGSLLLVGGTRNNRGTPYFTTLLGEVDALPASGAPWTSAPPLRTPRVGQTTTLLADGSVLVVGGCGNFPSWTPLASAEIYRPPHASTP